MKRFEQDAGAAYITSEVTRCLSISPSIDDIKVDTRKPRVRELHAKTMSNAYNYFKTPQGRANIMKGWEVAGISKAVTEARGCSDPIDICQLLNPFQNMSI